MHDLPPEVEALLEQARSAQLEPDLRTRERVKRGVAAAVAIGAIASSAGHVSAHAAAKTWLVSSLAAKITGVTLLGAVATGAVVGPRVLEKLEAPAAEVARRPRRVPRLPEVVATRPPAAAGTSAADTAALPSPLSSLGATAQASGATAGPVEQPAAANLRDGSDLATRSDPDLETALRAARALPPTGSLAAELRLLDQASQALAHGDPSGARALLQQHRARFERPVLLEERDALELIARCQLDPRATRADARAFLARSAHSVLSGSVARACGRAR